jgi:hypothetical protein
MNAVAKPVGAGGARRKLASKVLQPTQSQSDRELAAMKLYITKVTSSKKEAVSFLKDAGIIDKTGQLAKPFRP